MFTTIAVCVLTVFLMQSRPAGTQPSRADRNRAAALATEGWELWKKRDLTSAQEKFEEATALDPTSANHWNGLGWARYNGGDAAGGQKAFEKAIAIESDHPAARNGLGYIHFDQRQYKEAEKHWLIAVKNPVATAPFYGMAKTYLLTEQFDKALVYAEKAQKLSPADKTLKRVVDAAKARKLSPELRKLIEPAATGNIWGKQSPESARGWQHFSRGQYAEAREAFEAALGKNPKEMPAHNGLGFVLLNSGKIAEAQKHFEICLQADPNAGGPLNGMARCLKAEGKLDEAIATWEKLADLAPGVNAATYGLAEAYLEKGQYARSVELYEQLVKSEPQNPELKAALDRARQALAEKPKNQ